MKDNVHHRHAAALMGNEACGEDYATMALIESNLAIAFELRTANILAAQSTPDWLNDARVRMGEEPFPPSKDFSTSAKAKEEMLLQGVTLDEPGDLRCAKHITEGRDAGLRCWLRIHHEGECK